ncbi:MAG TPA: diphosphomevalonate decarboxylase [Thermoanaerobaculia bacterium]|nr:diphosphomevalonate decarboxylase [Thermoanaerobaculia bacterium]
MRATASAPANIAFVKYWGAADLERAEPLHPSISMTLESCRSITTVEALPRGDGDDVWLLDGEGGVAPAAVAFAAAVSRHLARLRDRLPLPPALRVTTRNTFPAAAGIASSASGGAALALAAARLLGIDPGPAQLAELARCGGSGSAARSVLGGYVEWPADGVPDGPPVQLAGDGHWQLRDLVVVVDATPKGVSSREGHRRAPTSPHFSTRRQLVPARLDRVRRAIAERDLAGLGPLLEEEAIELHLIAMSARPPIFYWRPGTLAVLAAVRRLRDGGLAAWATLDAGPNVHVICAAADATAVQRTLAALPEVLQVLADGVGSGPRIEEEP